MSAEDKTLCAGKRLHPAVLTSQIKKARTIQALVCTYSAHKSHLDCIHVSACWIAFDKLARQSAERTGLCKKANALQPLVQCTVQAARIGDIGVRQLANIAYGAAGSSRGKQMGALFIGLATTAEHHMAGFNTQELSNTAWAFVTAR